MNKYCSDLILGQSFFGEVNDLAKHDLFYKIHKQKKRGKKKKKGVCLCVL